ncbi:hypothetical protein X777_02653, partial [Ooceraea biroi]
FPDLRAIRESLFRISVPRTYGSSGLDGPEDFRSYAQSRLLKTKKVFCIGRVAGVVHRWNARKRKGHGIGHRGQ